MPEVINFPEELEAFNPRAYDLIEHSNADHARTVLVDWMLGNTCSYACSYCPADLHDGTLAWQTSASIIAFYDTLHAHYTAHRGKQVWLQFTGGEPTMHPHIVKLLEHATARDFKVSLISNASRTVRFWEKISPHLDSVILTYHNEFAEIAHFQKVGVMVAAQMPVHINVTMHPDRFDRTFDEALSLRDAMPSASISLKPLRVDFRTELFEYTAEQLQRMTDGVPVGKAFDGTTPRGTMTVSGGDVPAPVRMRANEFIIRNENRWAGYRCNAGLESLRIKADGGVTRAVCSVGGELGRLGQPIRLPSAPIICNASACGCVADILITKSRRRD